MSSYKLPTISSPAEPNANEVILIASGDSRLVANQTGWEAQSKMEAQIAAAFEAEGFTIRRANPVDPKKRHGFIDCQKMGMEVFEGIHPKARIIVAEAVWQYSHHVLAGLRKHEGTILTIANWSGQWPGLVGLLNLNGSLTKMGVKYSSIWSQDFTDSYFRNGVNEWLTTGKIGHDASHVKSLGTRHCGVEEVTLGMALAAQVKHELAIFGVFDEGCMGMYNAIIDDEMLNKCGIYKERLSQSALLAEMLLVTEREASGVYQWLLDRDMKFVTGSDPVSDLVEEHILGPHGNKLDIIGRAARQQRRPRDAIDYARTSNPEGDAVPGTSSPQPTLYSSRGPGPQPVDPMRPRIGRFFRTITSGVSSMRPGGRVTCVRTSQRSAR